MSQLDSKHAHSKLVRLGHLQASRVPENGPVPMLRLGLDCPLVPIEHDAHAFGAIAALTVIARIVIGATVLAATITSVDVQIAATIISVIVGTHPLSWGLRGWTRDRQP